ncbi:MAG: putative Type pilus pilin [Parcubacteria group bacterium]|nr:putative Type pilus pilin [Parcubacteria group bacterium]
MMTQHTSRRNSSSTQNRGFTLVELIVSIGLFTIVVTIAMSAYLSLISLDRKARATNDLVSNLSFVMESMSRNIRTGTSYACGGYGSGPNCWGGGGSSAFYFVDETPQSVTYRRTVSNGIGGVGICTGTTVCNDSTATPLTDPRINITNLTFYTDGVGNDPLNQLKQPRVLFTVTGTITPDPKSSPITFTIEGGATERLIEL